MLKTMRKNLKSLAPALWFVIAAFIISIFAVWGGAGRLGESRGSNTIAEVGGKKIEAQTYTRALMQRLQAMQEQFQELDANFIQQMNLPQQVLEQLIQRNVMIEAARRLGVRVGPNEIRERVKSYPVFQKDGAFIGFAEYQRILTYNRISPSEFEKGLATDLLIEKTIDVLTAGAAATRSEIWKNYRKTNESAQLEYILVAADKMPDPDEPSQDTLSAYFKNHAENYRMPEKRSADYIFFNTEELAAGVTPEDAAIEGYYRDNPSRFMEPARTRVSRIFIPAEDQNTALAVSQAEELKERIAAGEDFADLARSFSKDEKASSGGDWGEFDWKRLSRAEQDAVEALEVGAVSDPLELEDGAALLKPTEKNPETRKSLTLVREEIIRILKDQEAGRDAERKIADLEKAASKAEGLEPAAQSLGYALRNTGLMENGDPIEDIDPQGSFSRALFDLEPDQVSQPVYTIKGVGLAQLRKTEESRPARFEEVEDRIKQDYLEEKRKSSALEKARALIPELRTRGFETTAERHDLEVKSAQEHKREQYLSVIGENPEVDDLAFSLPLKEISEPLAYPEGYLLLQVLDRKLVTEEEFEENLAQERETFLETARNRLFQSYYLKLRENIGVKANYNLFLKLNSDILARFQK